MATSSGGYKIDTSDLRKLARDLEKSVPGIRLEMNETVAESAGLVATEARALSSWSSRIPGSVTVKGTLARVVVKAGGPEAPHAAPYEHGGVPGQFRHPVFGNRKVWVTQVARPFLGPAAERKGAAMEVRLHRGVDAVLRSVGL